MITIHEPIHNSTGTLTPIAKEVEKKETFYLCDYKSDVHPVYDRPLRISERKLEFLKNLSKKK